MTVERDPSKSWIEDEAYFKAQCETGKSFERFVAEKLTKAGVSDVIHTDDGFRESVGEIAKFTKMSGDLKIKGWPFEVKSRTENFRSPADWRYWPMFVDTLGSYEQKKVKPIGYIFVSQHTGALLAVSTHTRKHWKIREKFDHKRQISETFLCVAKEHVLDEAELIKKLVSMPQNPAV